MSPSGMDPTKATLARFLLGCVMRKFLQVQSTCSMSPGVSAHYKLSKNILCSKSITLYHEFLLRQYSLPTQSHGNVAIALKNYFIGWFLF